jgi:hypothetical protein
MIPKSKTEPQSGREERIRARAYQLWLEEGQPAGRDREHWERARQMVEQEDAPPEPLDAAPDPSLSEPVTSLIDPPVKTKTAAKKKRSLKSAKA